MRDRHVITIYINKKSYMESRVTQHILPGVTLKGQSQEHSDFEALYLLKENGICYY